MKSPELKIAVGCDIGHSTVKISFAQSNGIVQQIIFPSVAVPAFTISDETESARAAKETVLVNGTPYFFGDTALFQSAGVAAAGLVDDWIEKPEHTALLLGAIKKVTEAGVDIKNATLCLGLPTNLCSRFKDRLKDLVNGLVDVDAVMVMPQAVAPYQTIVFDESGFPIENGRVLLEDAWGVVEVGYYTTDFMLIDKGRFFQGAEGAGKGVHVSAQRLMRTLAERGLDCDLFECEGALRTKTIKNFGKTVDVSAEVDEAISEITRMVVDEATRLMKDKARRLSGVLIAGGGAPLVFDQIREQWSHAVMADNFRFSVAEGMRRYGEADLRRRGFPVVK